MYITPLSFILRHRHTTVARMWHYYSPSIKYKIIYLVLDAINVCARVQCWGTSGYQSVVSQEQLQSYPLVGQGKTTPSIHPNAPIVSPMRIGLHQWDRYFIPLITLSSSNIPSAKQSILLGQQRRPSHIKSAKSFHKEIVMKIVACI